MEELHIIGVDLAKRVFQVHGADRARSVLQETQPPAVHQILSRDIELYDCHGSLREVPSLRARGGKGGSHGSPYPTKLRETIREAAQE